MPQCRIWTIMFFDLNGSLKKRRKKAYICIYKHENKKQVQLKAEQYAK